uniref:Uncharacterized protein n=1 Tax=Anguilla anguilla TaxID=7936 RepID=A0A0E9SLQ0_ANGAN
MSARYCSLYCPDPSSSSKSSPRSRAYCSLSGADSRRMQHISLPSLW